MGPARHLCVQTISATSEEVGAALRIPSIPLLRGPHREVRLSYFLWLTGKRTSLGQSSLQPSPSHRSCSLLHSEWPPSPDLWDLDAAIVSDSLPLCHWHPQQNVCQGKEGLWLPFVASQAPRMCTALLLGPVKSLYVISIEPHRSFQAWNALGLTEQSKWRCHWLVSGLHRTSWLEPTFYLRTRVLCSV